MTHPMIAAGFKGRAKKIEDIDLPRIAHQIGVGEDELHCFMDVESLGDGFDSQGRPAALFEPHVFYRNLAGASRDRAVSAGLAYKTWGLKPYPRDSYPRIAAACEIDMTAALLATSCGLTQILGENYHNAGFDSVEAMWDSFMDDEDNHLEATVTLMVKFGIDDDMRRLAALQRKTTSGDCADIARVWNGPQYQKHNYHGRLADRHNWWRGIRDTPWSPGDGEDIQSPPPQIETRPSEADARAALDVLNRFFT